jgi:fatty acid desaturase
MVVITPSMRHQLPQSITNTQPLRHNRCHHDGTTTDGTGDACEPYDENAKKCPNDDISWDTRNFSFIFLFFSFFLMVLFFTRRARLQKQLQSGEGIFSYSKGVKPGSTVAKGTSVCVHFTKW